MKWELFLKPRWKLIVMDGTCFNNSFIVYFGQMARGGIQSKPMGPIHTNKSRKRVSRWFKPKNRFIFLLKTVILTRSTAGYGWELFIHGFRVFKHWQWKWCKTLRPQKHYRLVAWKMRAHVPKLINWWALQWSYVKT